MTPYRVIREGVETLLEHYAVRLAEPAKTYLARQFHATFGELAPPLWAKLLEGALRWFRLPEPAECWRFIPPPPWSHGRMGYADPAHAKESAALIGQILAGECRGAARVEALQRMAEKYPGVGWERAVEHAERELGM